jgi:microcystin-dependent protein
MSNPFVAEIRIFPYNFAPRGWATCDNQILSIAQNTALFSLLGTTYGGNGQTSFALPDFRNRMPMFWGNGPGLTPRDLGELGGTSTVTLLTTEMPAHSHNGLSASLDVDDIQLQANPTTYITQVANNKPIYSNASPTVQMSAQSMLPTGGNQPHNNQQPYLGLLFCIALQGIFPPRS